MWLQLSASGITEQSGKRVGDGCDSKWRVGHVQLSVHREGAGHEFSDPMVFLAGLCIVPYKNLQGSPLPSECPWILNAKRKLWESAESWTQLRW